MKTLRNAGRAVVAVMAAALCQMCIVAPASGASRTWVPFEAGDLMEPANWGGGTPAANDTLSITNSFEGDLTFPAETPASGAFNTITIQRGLGKARAFNPGKDHALHVDKLNIRYGEIFAFSSGSYDIRTQLAIALSTAKSDYTKVAITGEDTYLKTPKMQIGSGSKTSNRSTGEVTIKGGATVDSKLEVGIEGGWKNSLLVTGAGTHLYSTNYNVNSYIGSTQVVEKAFYSQSNTFTVANGASYRGSNLRIGADDFTTCGNVFSVTNYATASVSNLFIYGTNKVIVADGGELNFRSVSYNTKGSEIIVSNGVVNSEYLYIGQATDSCVGNALRLMDGAAVTARHCYIFGTNAIVVSGGELAITNSIYVGRSESASGDYAPGGSLLDVCGGRVTMKGGFSIYLGVTSRRVDGAAIRVTNGGEMVLTNGVFNVIVGANGVGHSLTVAGAGSKVLHYPSSTARNVVVGASSPDYAHLLTRDNVLSVSDGGYFMTQASVVVGKCSTNETIAVSGGTADIGQNLQLGYDTDYNGEFTSNATFSVSGSQSRVRIGKSILAGANSRIVFDLADAQGSAEALVQLGTAPTFADGSVIYVTSSDPQINDRDTFDCTLLSCEQDMDLSNVRIELDPNAGIRRLAAGNPRSLKVRAGRIPGALFIIR